MGEDNREAAKILWADAKRHSRLRGCIDSSRPDNPAMRIALLAVTLCALSLGCEKRVTEARAVPSRSLPAQTIAANFSAVAITGAACDAPCN